MSRLDDFDSPVDAHAVIEDAYVVDAAFDEM